MTRTLHCPHPTPLSLSRGRNSRISLPVMDVGREWEGQRGERVEHVSLSLSLSLSPSLIFPLRLAYVSVSPTYRYHLHNATIFARQGWEGRFARVNKCREPSIALMPKQPLPPSCCNSQAAAPPIPVVWPTQQPRQSSLSRRRNT